MGANFGDLDNDGWLDFYLGTGYPDYEGLIPNVMYRNRGGTGFADVTTAGGFGHLQKGHGVSFADLDNDGDQDVFEQMGGAYPGDGFADVLFENPGFGNHWIAVKLVGARSNRSAIGARIRVEIVERGHSAGRLPLGQQRRELRRQPAAPAHRPRSGREGRGARSLLAHDGRNADFPRCPGRPARRDHRGRERAATPPAEGDRPPLTAHATPDLSLTATLHTIVRTPEQPLSPKLRKCNTRASGPQNSPQK